MLADFALRLLDLAPGTARRALEPLAAGGKTRRAPAVHQLRADLGFQFANQNTDRRLSDRQEISGTSKTASLADQHQGMELPKTGQIFHELNL